jgi:protein gp37
MADGTNISWADATWNVITGCSVISPGCRNCYAMRLAGTRLQHHPSREGLTLPSKGGPVWSGEVRFNEQWLDQPLKWRTPKTVFPVAHGDLFHPNVPDAWRNRIFGVMAKADHHRYMVLTKRPEVAAEYLSRIRLHGDIAWRLAPLAHVLIGVSIEDEPRARKHLPALQAISGTGWRTWVSYEPALGSVDWTGYGLIEFLVAGGESSQTHSYRARPTRVAFQRAARDWCERHGVTFHFKQWGNWIDADHWFDIVTEGGSVIMNGRDRWAPRRPLNFADAERLARITGERPFSHYSDGTTMIWVGKHAAGAVLDGREHRDMPRAA